MSTKNKPGIHVFKQHNWKPIKRGKGLYLGKPEYYWQAIAPNGRITANGETYSRKSIALNSIQSTSLTLGGKGSFKYYDHSKKDSPLTSYP
jgi:uncharacterized protein YegP (UPF0339 family)